MVCAVGGLGGLASGGLPLLGGKGRPMGGFAASFSLAACGAGESGWAEPGACPRGWEGVCYPGKLCDAPVSLWL